jgi:hypothetical protein
LHPLFERYPALAAPQWRSRRPHYDSCFSPFLDCPWADFIVVLDSDGLGEFGTHDQLTAKKGDFAEIYQIYGFQAAAYWVILQRRGRFWHKLANNSDFAIVVPVCHTY